MERWDRPAVDGVYGKLVTFLTFHRVTKSLPQVGEGGPLVVDEDAHQKKTAFAIFFGEVFSLRQSVALSASFEAPLPR